MTKKKQNTKNNPNVEMLKLDPLVEKAIYAKRDVFLTFITESGDKQPTCSHFSIIYTPEIDTYQFCDGPASKAHFLATIYSFIKYPGVLTVRTFLDDISHHRFLPDGRSVAVPFQEIRMFQSTGHAVLPVSAINVFAAMISDARTGKIDWNRFEKNEFFCDDQNRFSAEEMKRQLETIL